MSGSELIFSLISLTHTYTAGKSRFGNLLSLAHSPGKQDRLYMKGPGGRGEVEVAVSGVVGMKFTDGTETILMYFVVFVFQMKCNCRAQIYFNLYEKE